MRSARSFTVLARDDGFTMAAVMMGMLVLMSLSVAAFGAANGDIRLGQRSVDEKKAYSAAEAGIAYYLQKLSQDNDYWTRCTNGPSADETNPVNQIWDGAGADPRKWRRLPTSAEQQYAIELLPRAGRPACVPGDNESMIDPGQGTLRIRSTGRSRGVYRSTVSTLRRNGFLDFIYFTNFETSDPAQQALASPTSNWRNIEIRRMAPAAARVDTNPPDKPESWASEKKTCAQWWRGTDADRLGRSSAQGYYPGSGRFDPDGSPPLDWYPTSYFGQGSNIQCSQIQFRGDLSDPDKGDKIEGPFHSNDHICVNNNPSFGRSGKNDRIEFFGFHPNCQSSATFNSTPKTGADLVTLGVPQSNASLQATTFAPYRFSGKTEIVLQGDRMRVTRSDGSTSTLAIPANGLVYVDNSTATACPKWDIRQPYAVANGDAGCGDALVSGTYSKSLTIATKRDVIITGDVEAADGSDALLGLIADNYVRVKHTMASYPCDVNTPDSPRAPQNRTIEAAMLSLTHVFTVDNYQCGDPLGNLTVYGAIAQQFRGPVGTSSGGTPVTGYNKVYKYDDRLRFRSPPYFITPVESAWRVLRTAEQSAATRPQ